MQTRPVLLTSFAALASVLATGCKGVDCGEGTTERNGICVPASETVGTATCGKNTMLQGDTCISTVPQIKCGEGTRESAADEAGVKTCIGTGGGPATGCAVKLDCPEPATGKQTICGQIYDFETGDAFAVPGATGAPCTTATATGPCALGVKAYDAAVFAQSNGSAGALTVGATYIDDCGRYRLSDVSQPGLPGLVAIGVDDTATRGPGGLANPVGVSLAFAADRATPDVEAFTVKPATIAGYRASLGNTGPSIADGIYALIFRSRSTGSQHAAGVTVTRKGGTDSVHDYYFGESALTRTTLEATGSTGANGTALFTITNPQLDDVYSGTGGTQCNCVWPQFLAQPVPGVMFVQIFRPTSAPGMTCPL